MLRNVIGQQLVSYELTLNEWLLLGVVVKAPVGGITLSQIADSLNVSQPQVTAIMISVLKKRLVKQKVSSKDKRIRYVQLTVRGKRLVVELETAFSNLTTEWLADLPPEIFESFIQTLEYLTGQKTNLSKGDIIKVKQGEST